MVTCRYCGSNLDLIGSYKSNVYFYCDFCNMNFKSDEVCEDRKRKTSVPSSYDSNYYQPTTILLKYNTIELFHMLKDCRKDWYSVNQVLEQLKVINADPEQRNKDSQASYDSLFKEYEQLTKQKFVIENILLEKAGFIPDKLTDEFLGQLVEYGNQASRKPMYIYIKNPNKKESGEVELEG